MGRQQRGYQTANGRRLNGIAHYPTPILRLRFFTFSQFVSRCGRDLRRVGRAKPARTCFRNCKPCVGKRTIRNASCTCIELTRPSFY